MLNSIILFIDTPSQPTLLSILSVKYSMSENISESDIIISETVPTLISAQFDIRLSSSPNPDREHLFIDINLPIDVIILLIEQAIEVYLSTKSMLLTPAIKIIDNDNVKDPFVQLKKHQEILNNIPVSILNISSKGEILYYNRSFKTLYSPTKEITETNILNILDTDTAGLFRSFFKDFRIMPSFTRNFIGGFKSVDGVNTLIEGQILAFSEAGEEYGVLFDSVISTIKNEQALRKLEEQSIISGFSRHISHNVMNALTAAGGFIRQIRSKTESNLYTQNLWKIIENKLQLIEEVVVSYSDYTHALSFLLQDEVDITELLMSEIKSISNKKIDKNFSAQLYRFVDNFNMTYDFSDSIPYKIKANKMFLKLAFCYIIKDNIRFFADYLPLSIHVSIKCVNNKFCLSITISDIEISDHILTTMLDPWDHSMVTQSFDYWGVVIAKMIAERHHGHIEILKLDKGLSVMLIL